MANKSLPTITSPSQLIKMLKIWQTAINPLLSTIPTPKAPWNFQAKNAHGGIQLSWTPLSQGADGYQLLRSSTPDFSSLDATYTLPGGDQMSFFDAVATSGGSPTVTKYYKLRATAGTQSNPQSILGVLTGIVSNTTIALTDNTTVPSTNYDTTTTDKSQIQAGRAIRPIFNPKLQFPQQF